MDESQTHQAASTKLHTLAAATSGALGGLFGLAGVAFELPVTTTVIMRSIADVARSEGFVVADLHVQMECISVFGLGGTQAEGADTGYFAARAALQMFAASVGAEMGKMAAKSAARVAQS